MEEQPFFKFPRTPHMAGSEVVDDDEVITEEQMNSMIKSYNITNVIVQEKVDVRNSIPLQFAKINIIIGANVSVHFEEEWQPIIQKRSGIVGNGEKPQYNVYRDYIYQHMETLWNILSNKYCLFGEWLWCKHSVGYDALPDFFVVFDILDKTTNKFITYDQLVKLIDGKFTVVPLVKRFTSKDMQQSKLGAELKKLVDQPSNYGKETQEGVYIRFEDVNEVRYRCKMRRKTFTAGRTNFESQVINNNLAPKKEL